MSLNQNDLADPKLHKRIGAKLGNPNTLISLLPRMSFREYTVASSPLKDHNSLELCVKLVEHVVPREMTKENSDSAHTPGLCSSFLKALKKEFDEPTESGRKIGVYSRLQRSPFSTVKFKAYTRFLFISNGSGIALTKSFLEHLNALCSNNHSLIFEVKVFAGYRREENVLYPSLFKDTEEALSSQISCDVKFAFSRIGKKKVWVQRKLMEDKADLKKFFSDGTEERKDVLVCLCGNGAMIEASNGSLKRILGKKRFTSLRKSGSYIVEPFT